MSYKAVINDNNYLVHYNKNHDRFGKFARGDGDGDGQTEYQDSLRRKSDSKAARDRLDAYYKNEGKENYTSTKKGPSGSNRSRNPYVDNDGNLTPAGERRWEAEKLANRQKSKKNQVDEDALKDPNKWVKDDLNTVKELAKSTKELSDTGIKLVDQIFPTKQNEKIDLSKMSDQELRQILNREQLERQYNDMFNKPQENKGKEFVKKALEINSTIAGTAVTGLTIAWLIKNLVIPAAAVAAV